eukprot:TRINITY_DN5570_c0_g1_i2.p1 TRINITY_DN5570_c0_g1~~TRINITY_DN5570_c0_g1_i2.p1  ORF type:complete len:756 (-),score=129.83 TRINITY_DN5570_c0_g1_i2:225-2492(-)
MGAVCCGGKTPSELPDPPTSSSTSARKGSDSAEVAPMTAPKHPAGDLRNTPPSSADTDTNPPNNPGEKLSQSAHSSPKLASGTATAREQTDSENSSQDESSRQVTPQPQVSPALLAERRRLLSVLSTMDPEQVHQLLKDKTSSLEGVRRLSEVMPPQRFPKVERDTHCVRCHEWYDPAYPAGCRVPHAQRKDFMNKNRQAWSLPLYDEPIELEWEDQFHYQEYADERGSVWMLACCGETYHSHGYNADVLPDDLGYCFDGEHTDDPSAVDYNGINIRHCCLDYAKDILDEYAATAVKEHADQVAHRAEKKAQQQLIQDAKDAMHAAVKAVEEAVSDTPREMALTPQSGAEGADEAVADGAKGEEGGSQDTGDKRNDPEAASGEAASSEAAAGEEGPEEAGVLCVSCHYPELPDGRKCMCEFCDCGKIHKRRCRCGSHQRAALLTGMTSTAKCRVLPVSTSNQMVLHPGYEGDTGVVGELGWSEQPVSDLESSEEWDSDVSGVSGFGDSDLESWSSDDGEWAEDWEPTPMPVAAPVHDDGGFEAEFGALDAFQEAQKSMRETPILEKDLGVAGCLYGCQRWNPFMKCTCSDPQRREAQQRLLGYMYTPGRSPKSPASPSSIPTPMSPMSPKSKSRATVYPAIKPKDKMLRLVDIPRVSKRTIERAVKLDGKNKAFKRLASSWQPDAFLRKFGLSLNPEERGLILKRVTGTYKLIQAVTGVAAVTALRSRSTSMKPRWQQAGVKLGAVAALGGAAGE